MKMLLPGSVSFLLCALLSSGCQESAATTATSASAGASATPTAKSAEATKDAASSDDCVRVKTCCDAAEGGTKKWCEDTLAKGKCSSYMKLVGVTKTSNPASYEKLPAECKALAP